jgi:hypothetical protein
VGKDVDLHRISRVAGRSGPGAPTIHIPRRARRITVMESASLLEATA